MTNNYELKQLGSKDSAIKSTKLAYDQMRAEFVYRIYQTRIYCTTLMFPYVRKAKMQIDSVEALWIYEGWFKNAGEHLRTAYTFSLFIDDHDTQLRKLVEEQQVKIPKR